VRDVSEGDVGGVDVDADFLGRFADCDLRDGLAVFEVTAGRSARFPRFPFPDRQEPAS
jgi:hypothetical protein